MKLPRVSGKDVIRALQRAGYDAFDQEGSHVYLHKWESEKWGNRVTVPFHGNEILKAKTLKRILEQAESFYNFTIKA
ncbi:MAG: type II toxin-antitoxin system HicA family toxin [Candidatus Xenobiia bacterium LiM19]